MIAILIGLVGVLLLSEPPRGSRRPRASCQSRVGAGLTAGLLFTFSAVGYCGAATAPAGGDVFLRAAFTLAWVTAFQAVAMGVWRRWCEPGEIMRVAHNWRVAGLVGVSSMVGSLGWFTAFTLQTAAYVKALGQIELVFSFLATHFVFGERSSGREVAAMGLIVLSIMVLVAAL